MLDRAGGVLATKDGVAVAWELEPAGALARLGVRAVQAACAQVNKTCGDGTSTVAVLIRALFAESLRQIVGGEPPARLSRQMQETVAELLDSGVLDFLHLPVEDEETLFHVAQVASNHDEEVARAIVDLVAQVGVSGVVVVEEGHGRSVEVDFKRGFEFDRGWESSDFAGEGGAPRVLPVTLVALVDGVLTKMADVVSLLEEATQFPHPLVVVSRGCFGEALQTLVANDRKLERASGGRFEVVATRVAGREDRMREHFEDLAALTGAEILDPSVRSLTSVNAEVFGSAQTVTLKATSSVFTAFPDKFEGIEARVQQLRQEEGKITHSHDLEVLRTRIARLTDGLGVLRVGGASQAELRERRGRVEDAFQAVRRAVEGGIVPGGGVAYLALSEALQQASRGTAAENVLIKGLQAPLRTLLEKSQVSPAEVFRQIVGHAVEGLPSWGLGWDAASESLRDFRDPLLCDPLSVVREVVNVAVSTVSMLVNVGCTLTRVGSS
jgi:chaperonin GroEL